MLDNSMDVAMNITIDSVALGGSINPYSDPIAYCGVVVQEVENYYQSLLHAWWGAFLLGGVIVGMILGFIITLYWLNREQKASQEHQ